MRILTGDHEGDGYRPHQWANTWIHADPPGGGHPVIANPGNVELDDADLERFQAHRARWEQDHHTGGRFWVYFQIDGRRFTLTETGRVELTARSRRRPASQAPPQ